MTIEDGGLAFPSLSLDGDYRRLGMTYREWLIGQALIGAAEHAFESDLALVGCAFDVADAVITRLKAEVVKDENR